MSSHRIMEANNVGVGRESDSLFNTTSHENQCPPAYSEASPTTDFSQTCCASDLAIQDLLRRNQSFNFTVQDLSAYHCLVQESRRLLFLYWCAYSLGSSVSATEGGRMRCPLLGCHEVFYYHTELVDHVGKCPHLAQGEYYCPYHKREERFAEPTTVEIAAVTSNTSRKHFLKGAINALRRGSRSIRNAIHPTSRATQRQFLGQEQKSAQNEITAEREVSKHMARPNTHELDGQEFTPVIPRTTASYIQELPGVCQHFEMEAATSTPAELDSPFCPSMEWSPTTSTSESVSSPISPVSPVNGPPIRSFEDAWSPVSPTDTINPFSNFVSPVQPIKPQTSSVYPKAPKSSCPVYELWATPVAPISRTMTAFMLPNLQEHIYAPQHEIAAVRDRAGQRMLEYNNIAESSGILGIRNTFGVVEHTDVQPSNIQESIPQDLDFDDVAMTDTHELGQNQILKEVVTDNILFVSGLEDFRSIIIDAEKLLSAPRVVGPDELRMVLVHNAIWCAKSPEVLEKFTLLVDYLYEMAKLALYMERPVGEDYDLHKLDPFQYGYSSIEQSDFQHTDQQQQAHPVAASNLYSPSKASAVTRLSELPAALVSPTMYAENIVLNQGTYSGIQSGYSSPQSNGMHPSSNIPDTPELGNVFWDDHPNNTPRTEQPTLTAADPASSPFSPGRGSLTCPQCRKVFTGKLDWLPSNLQRHIREKHTEGGGKRLSCTVHGCLARFSRKSNLQVHLNSVHKETSGR